jgi:hemoglobin-like flavoprotein
MTPEQIELIKSSWVIVVPIAVTAADLCYDRLFEIAPQARVLFPDDMAWQKKTLLAMLGRVVVPLNNLSDIVPQVQSLGERHIGYGAQAAHYPMVGEALLGTLERGLGDGWNDDLKDAWATAYVVL